MQKENMLYRVDSDDFVNINFLNFLFWYLETNKSADAVACDYLLLDDCENELKDVIVKRAYCMWNSFSKRTPFKDWTL